ncbi:MAG TPA: hypothetical protein VFT66_01645 [Roseiflexaceae bacterium]|nr:hypothetical protein [Roseiflexaceae bacterium]
MGFTTGARVRSGALWSLIILAIWGVVLSVLLAQPAASLDAATGIYARQDAATPYQWTSNRAQIPIFGNIGPTIAWLAFGPSQWQGRPRPTITLSANQQVLTSFAAPNQVRRYAILLAPQATILTIQSPIARAADDPRWLGVTLYGLAATPHGWPLRAVVQSLLALLALLILIVMMRWSMRHGYGMPVALTLLALALRVVLLQVTPPGFRQDEAVSLVDAWHIAQTGHDHLGNFLPIGAQEALGDWISPLLTYLELPLVAFFGPLPIVGRLVTACVGALAAPFGYMLARMLALPWRAAACVGIVVALSPWQMFLNRIALPPALVPTMWTLCLLAGVHFIQRGNRRAAYWLALAAGVAVYAYPTLKLAVPLLVAWAGAIALLQYGWPSVRRWLGSVVLLMVLWLPVLMVTLFNQASSTRLNQAAIKAASLGEWVTTWWNGYRVYFLPDFYYWTGDGSSLRGVPDHGVELLVGAPLVLLGLGVLLWRAGSEARRWVHERRTNATEQPKQTIIWWFMLGALLIAPLPSSVTEPSPHAYRAATIAPLYALLVGMGAALVLQGLARISAAPVRRAAQNIAVVLFSGLLAWQAGRWFRDYAVEYPPRQALDNQDGLLHAMRLAVAAAPNFDEVWISYHDTDEPYIYLLAAQPMPAAQAQAQIQVTRAPGDFNKITSIGKYHFLRVTTVPIQQPILDAVLDQYGGPAFVLQAWQQDGKNILIVRRME